jgi:sulfite reductase alpha subunit-like flavoprotein
MTPNTSLKHTPDLFAGQEFLEVPEEMPVAHIYYGSQTGTGEAFCRTLYNEAQQLGINAKMSSMDEFKKNKFEENSIAIICIATYGVGGPTENSVDFYYWLEKQLKTQNKELLSQMKYSVFGLGNR